MSDNGQELPGGHAVVSLLARIANWLNLTAVATIVALLLSVFNFYFNYLYVSNRLAVTSTEAGYDWNGLYMTVVVSNGGNQDAAILRIEPVLWSPDAASCDVRWKRLEAQVHYDAARKAHMTLHIEKIKPDENVTRALTRVASSSPLLVVPDSSLFTPDNLRTILESTYRRNQVVVGFSTSLVKAGTTATAYSTIDDVLAQLEHVVASISSGAVPPATFPRYWRVAVNESVARSLNVVVTDEVRALGERPPGKP